MSLKKKDQDAIAMILTEMYDNGEAYDWSNPYKDDVLALRKHEKSIDRESGGNFMWNKANDDSRPIEKNSLRYIINHLKAKYPKINVERSGSLMPPIEPNKIFNVLKFLNQAPIILMYLSLDELRQLKINGVNLGKLWDSLETYEHEKSFDGSIDYEKTIENYNS